MLAETLSTLPATVELLTQGGDARIATGPDGRNKYGCLSRPEPGLVALGSSTATGVSEAGYAAADTLRNRLEQALRADGEAAVYARELERMRGEFSKLCALPARTGIVFSASGTDAHRLAAQLAAHAPLTIIMMEAAESGSGVPAAMGEAGKIALASVALRDASGAPRPAAEIDTDFVALAKDAVAQGRRVLLVLADVSKTSLIAPGMACALELQRELRGKLDVLVDACQFRLAPATLNAYLERGCMVALTGSKFLTGPAFSGALLIPAAQGERTVPTTLSAHSARADWPHDFDTSALPDKANFGLLLRWQAALHEMRAFRALPEKQVEDFLREFAQAVQQRLADDPVFEALPVPAFDRSALGVAPGWDAQQTIFPFLLRHPHTGALLDREQTLQVYRLLQTSAAIPRFQLGQPVDCGQRNGKPASALRICASSRMAVEAARCGNRVVIEAAVAGMERVVEIVGDGVL